MRIPSARGQRREWLNGPLVWAIDEVHQPLSLFPRDCPRILIWATAATTPADRTRWLGKAPMVAFVERAWADHLDRAAIWRYRLPEALFEDLADAGMWVSRTAGEPLGAEYLADLPRELATSGVAVTPVSTLASLRQLWDTSLHVSGVRLRNAASWAALPALRAVGSDGL